MTAMLPLGILTHAIAPTLSSHSKGRCIEAWQQCQVDAELAATLRSHKLWPTLEYCLRTNQLWDYVPAALQKQLSQNRQVCAIRQLQIISQLEELDAALTHCGKQVILLKGAALVFYPIYPSLGDRGTADIDILVDTDDIAVVVQVLQNLGYIGDDDYTEPKHHLPPFRRIEAVPIEVHIAVQSVETQQPISFWLAQSAQPITEFPSLQLPNVTELFWHMAWHAHLSIPQLRNLLDLYRLQQLYCVDRELLEKRAKDEGMQKTWSILMQHLSELEQGRFYPQTIMTWEWKPAEQHKGYYAIEIFLRRMQNRWREMFKIARRRQPNLPAAVLLPLVITWWLFHYLLVSGAWLFNYVRLSCRW